MRKPGSRLRAPTLLGGFILVVWAGPDFFEILRIAMAAAGCTWQRMARDGLRPYQEGGLSISNVGGCQMTTSPASSERGTSMSRWLVEPRHFSSHE